MTAATKKTVVQAAIILGISLIFAVGSALFHPKKPAWYFVEIFDPLALEADVLRERLGDRLDSVLWVDARQTEKFEKEHMVGAISLNKEDWETLIPKNIEILSESLGKPVVVYCDRRCERSKEIADKLRQAVGLDPVYVLKGDWKKWVP